MTKIANPLGGSGPGSASGLPPDRADLRRMLAGDLDPAEMIRVAQAAMDADPAELESLDPADDTLIANVRRVGGRLGEVLGQQDGALLQRVEHACAQVAPQPRPGSSNIALEPPLKVAKANPPAKLPVPKPSDGGRRARLGWTIGLLASAGAILTLAGAVVILRTHYGTLVIETNDDSIEVRVTQDGRTVHIVDGEGDMKMELRPGRYGVELIDPPDGLVLTESGIEIRRGEDTVVRVTRDDRGPGRGPGGPGGPGGLGHGPMGGPGGPQPPPGWRWGDPPPPAPGSPGGLPWPPPEMRLAPGELPPPPPGSPGGKPWPPPHWEFTHPADGGPGAPPPPDRGPPPRGRGDDRGWGPPPHERGGPGGWDDRGPGGRGDRGPPPHERGGPPPHERGPGGPRGRATP